MTDETDSSGELAEDEPIIPYADAAAAPEFMRDLLDKYVERMDFLPNALRFYLHRPEIAACLFELNNRVMRDPSSTLEVKLKRRLGAYASKLNGCKYCTAHHCAVLQNPGGLGIEGWDMDDDEVRALLEGDFEPENNLEKACFDFVRAASLEPSAVTNGVLSRLVEHLTPAQVVELAAVVGFWKMYNTIHDSLHIPIEAKLAEQSTKVGL